MGEMPPWTWQLAAGVASQARICRVFVDSRCMHGGTVHGWVEMIGFCIVITYCEDMTKRVM